jgi:hypothetical protein
LVRFDGVVQLGEGDRRTITVDALGVLDAARPSVTLGRLFRQPNLPWDKQSAKQTV